MKHTSHNDADTGNGGKAVEPAGVKKQKLGDMTVREFFTKVGHAAGTGAFLGPAIVVGVIVAVIVASYVPLTFNPTSADASESQDTDPDLSMVDTSEVEQAPEPAAATEDDAGSVDMDNLQDGTYTGSGTGFTGTITVQVTISGGKMTDIQIVSSEDSGSWFESAKGVIQRVLNAQSTDVDVVSGATYSSRGILQAIRNALAQASGGEQEALSEATGAASASAGHTIATVKKVDTSNLQDGVYTGSGTGYTGEIVTRVTISGGKIANIEIVSSEDSGSWFERAKAVIQSVLSAQSVEVDTVTNATYSSRGILSAVADALSKAQGSASNTDVDKTTLNAAIAAADAVERGDYTDESWKYFQQAIGSAKQVVANESATQEQVDAAVASLDAARNSLAGPDEIEYVGYALCRGDLVEDGFEDDFNPYYIGVKLRVSNGIVEDVASTDIFTSKSDDAGNSVDHDINAANKRYFDRAVSGSSKDPESNMVAHLKAYVMKFGELPSVTQIETPSTDLNAEYQVDTVTGATCSSTAIVQAFANALDKAKAAQPISSDQQQDGTQQVEATLPAESANE